MDELNHCEYYQARAESSRRLADRASDPHIAAIHQEMARRYEERREEARQHAVAAFDEV